MSDPVLVIVERGPMVESRHRGAVAVCRAGGETLLSLGGGDRPIYPRSAIKALQAVPLVESGAAAALELDDRELAVICASHGGEPEHIATVRGVLAKAGLDDRALACGAHWPLSQTAARALAACGRSPTAIHNNCSGKHAGMLALAVHEGLETSGYERPSHPVQVRVAAALSDMAGMPVGADRCAIDGCSVPTWGLPLPALALAMARLGTGAGLAHGRADACARLRHACMAEPWHVAGSGRFCTDVMARLAGRAFVKGGAEGVYCAALPEAGVGIALKIEDGAKRAAECAMAAVLAGLLPDAREELGPAARVPLANWRGATVGRIAASPELDEALEVLSAG